MPENHKRVASTSEPVSIPETKRQRTQKATPTKSQYFSEPGDEPEQNEEESASDTNEDASDFEDELPESHASELEDEEDDDASDSDHSPVSKSKKSSAKSTPKSNEVWKPGVKTGELPLHMSPVRRRRCL